MKCKIIVDTHTKEGEEIWELALKAKKGVEIEHPLKDGIPNGYMTSDDFFAEVKRRIIKKYGDGNL